MRTSDVGSLVPIETEPPKVAEDHLLRLESGAGLIGVFHSHDERAAMVAGKEPVENRRARTADVEMTGGRRSETNANRHAIAILSLDLPRKWRNRIYSAPVRDAGISIDTIAIAQSPSARPMNPR